MVLSYKNAVIRKRALGENFALSWTAFWGQSLCLPAHIILNKLNPTF